LAVGIIGLVVGAILGLSLISARNIETSIVVASVASLVIGIAFLVIHYTLKPRWIQAQLQWKAANERLNPSLFCHACGHLWLPAYNNTRS